MTTDATTEKPKELALVLSDEVLSRSVLTPAEVNTLINTVAKNATREEFDLFMYTARTYGLSPLRKEIYFVKYLRANQAPADVPGTIIVGRDGFLAIAHRSPEFEGLDGDVVRAGDDFKVLRGREGITVEHNYGTERGAVLGAWAICYRKGHRPTYFYAPLSEYKPAANYQSPWQKQESAMILKCAESTVLRKAFNIAGVAGEEEMSRQHAADAEPETPVVLIDEPRPALPSMPLTKATEQEVLRLLRNDDVIGPMEEEGFRGRLSVAGEAGGLALVAEIKALIANRLPQ